MKVPTKSSYGVRTYKSIWGSMLLSQKSRDGPVLIVALFSVFPIYKPFCTECLRCTTFCNIQAGNFCLKVFGTFSAGSCSNDAMGSHCLWPSGSCCGPCYFPSNLPCISDSFWPIHVACRHDLWLWSWFCDNHGWNYYWNDSSLFTWIALPG